MSSGKADINYTMEIIERSEVYDFSREPVLEKLDSNSFTNTNFDNKLTKFYGKIINIHFQAGLFRDVEIHVQCIPA